MITREQIMGSIIEDHYDDLAFIEELNNLTWARKVQLKAQLPNHHANGKATNGKRLY